MNLEIKRAPNGLSFRPAPIAWERKLFIELVPFQPKNACRVHHSTVCSIRTVIRIVNPGYLH